MAKRDYTESSGNVFADLGFPDAADRLAKAELAIKIADILHRRKLTQTQAAAVLGVDQPKVSALICGRLSGFSIERLLRFLLLLGADVAITVKTRQGSPRSGAPARGTKNAGKFPLAGILTVGNFVAAKSPKSRKKQQAAA